MALAQNIIPGARLEDYTLNKCVDLTASPPMEFFDLFGEPVLDFEGSGNAQDCLSMRLHLKATDKENDGPLLSVEELLGDTGGAQGSQHAVSSVDYGRGRSDGATEYPTDSNNTPTAGAKAGGDKSGETDGRSGVRLNSDGSISVEQGAEQGSPNTSATSVPGPTVRDFALPEKAQSSLSNPPPPLSPLPPPVDTVLSSSSNTQTDSQDSVLQDIGLRSSGDRKEKADTDEGHSEDGHKRDGDRTASGAAGIQDSSKRTADNAGLNEGGEGVPRSEKVRRIDPIDATDAADEDMSDFEFARLRALPTPVFRMPPSWRDSQERENTATSSTSSGAGDSQDDPLVIEDDGEKTDESGASTKATSVEPETGTAHPFSSHLRVEPKTLGCLSARTIPDPPAEPLDRPTSPNVALPQHLIQTDDKAEEEEANTEPNLIPSSLNVMPPTDHDDTGTDDDDDIRHLFKKRTSRYTPNWPHDREMCIIPDRGEVGGTQGKLLATHGEEPDTSTKRPPPQMDGITLKADHADIPTGQITHTPSLEGATDHQHHPMAPPPRPKRTSGHRKAVYLESQQWEIKKIIGKRRSSRGYEYNVVWTDSWLPRRELGNARRLMREFELKDSAQQKSRCGKSARDSSSEQ